MINRANLPTDASVASESWPSFLRRTLAFAFYGARDAVRNSALAPGLAAALVILAQGVALAEDPDRIFDKRNALGLKDTSLVGGPGGGAFRDMCATGQYLTGFAVRSGSVFDAVIPFCGTFNDRTGLIGAPGVPGDRHGGNGGGLQGPVTCNNDQYVSGVMFGYTTERDAAKYIASISMTCAPIKPGGRSSKVDIRSAAGRIGHGGFSCGDDRAVMGINGRAGIYVDALGLICGQRPIQTVAPQRPAANTQACNTYAAIAAQKSQLNVELACGGAGPRWTTKKSDHYNWCLTQNGNMTVANSEAQARLQYIANCQKSKPPAGHTSGASLTPCPPPRIRYDSGVCGCPQGTTGANCENPVVH
ncbi:hypothetical protein [Hyphomicrobium facile]|uniref:EGF-like domain-containing protein n=1 Tax=Hyphomicrobium facile TaxID=51670 RepID=A0A1I7NHM7_9HYPH|nr:hypothetical protein [Hyphomicrobium facile]SFV34133.1 hypothetical protein SAMN04488557_2230 [Hyphomicrobium facile]